MITRSVRLVSLAAVAVLALSACTAGGSAGTATTAGPPGSGGAVSSADGPERSDSASAPSSTAAPVSKAVIQATPGDAATGVSVIEPVLVRAENGILDSVVMTNPDGKEVVGAVSADGGSWTSGEPLGYARTYTITAQPGTPPG